MTYPRRPCAELPFSGRDIMLTYTHEHPAVPFEFEDTLEIWSVDITRYHDDDGCEQCSDTASCEASQDPRLGHMEFVRLRDYTADPGWDAADAHTGDLEKIVSVCTNPEYAMTPGLHWNKDFEDAVESPVGDLLVMDRVRLAPQWRGFGIGAFAAAEAIRRLAGGCCAVACEPASTDRAFEDGNDAAFTAAQTKIAAVWESVGFEPFRDGVHLLDPALRHMDDRRTAWQQHFGR
ncbi:hypothetical protein [Streptodolium elevatio]|uniref:N-acetyltransferase domain-containing protein n=1 Tax=Streptodolium elevatio TaxID=3157996 RepID=A0ABV3DYA9_9ACTN